jgi:uncharacterized protein YndB with AHSA1/START domain
MTDDKSITVTRTIDASAAEVFDVLSLPRRHVELDGSGFVRSVEHGDRISSTGQTFTMNMTGEHMGGDYQTDNHVTGYDANRLLAWRTAPAGTEPPGWQWVWQLEPQGPDSTEVRLTYDWSQVADRDLLEKVRFPLVSAEQLEDSLDHLAAAVSTP